MTQHVAIDQREFSFDELMTDDQFEESLVTNEIRCHGGYIDGEYVSPRGALRRPAIRNWRDRLRSEDQPLITIPEKYVPPNYPNYDQAKYLLQEGVVEPITRALTTIAIVEGFGARIREVSVPDFDTEIEESIEGTAVAHLSSGLFEAHARDEAGHRDQGGHKQMWEAARDAGLDRPEIPDDVLLRLMSGGPPAARKRLYPELSERMESMLLMMTNVLVIETFAEDTFNWAKKLLGDAEVSADPQRAAHLVDCIARDEVPHVDYLTVALSELRTRTLIGADGKTTLSGANVIDGVFRRQLRGMATVRPQQSRERSQADIHQAVSDKHRASSIARRFEELDSGWSFPHCDDEELDVLLKSA